MTDDDAMRAQDPGDDATLIDIHRPPDVETAERTDGQPAGPAMIACSLATDIGRVRRNNEDYVQAERVLRGNLRYSLWVVADGVGGGPKGELASRSAVETVVDYIVHAEWDDSATALTQAFALANRNVYEITGEGAAASTMVAALISEPEGVATIANVGDSRAYLVVGEEARPITDDHSMVAARVAAGQITALEAKTAPDRNVLTRSVGSETDLLVDVFGPRQLALSERLVLCTDGIHGMIDDEAIGRIGGGYPIADAAGALVAAAVEAGGRDNATALVGGYAPVAAAPAVGFEPGGTAPSEPDLGASGRASVWNGPDRGAKTVRSEVAGGSRRPSRLAILVAIGLIAALVTGATMGVLLIGAWPR